MKFGGMKHIRIAVLGIVCAVCMEATAQQPTPRDTIYNSACIAFNDGNFTFAIDRFREYLKTSPTPQQAASAQYALGVALLDGPKDRDSAVVALAAAVAVPDFPERAFALYYLGLALRGQGIDLNAASAGKAPTEAASLITQSEARLAQAAAQFSAAADAFAAAKTGQPAVMREWSARARCDSAELLIRLKQYRKAAAAVEPLIEGKQLKTSTYRSLALYYHGYACFGLGDYVGAGRSLGQLAPFNQGDFGGHVRYLLARSHHLSGESPEAMMQYEAVVASWSKQRAAALEALKTPAKLKPEEKAALEAVAAAAPEYVAKAMYYWGQLLADSSQWEPALAKYAGAVQQFAKSPIAADARLQMGICQFQTKQWAAAVATLSTLTEHPTLSDQALRWLAKAQVELTNPDNKMPGPGGAIAIPLAPELAAYSKSILSAVDYLKKACDRAAALIPTDPDAKSRRALLLIELGDMQRRAGQYKEAVASYAAAVQVATSTAFAEQAAARHAIALQLAGDYAASDAACAQFAQKYPTSPFAAEISLRYAENALLSAYAAGGSQARQMYPEAQNRFAKVLKTYPNTPHATLAKLGTATVLYQTGQFAEAASMLGKIPEGDRSIDMAGVSYLQADCVVRTLPESAEDALSVAKAVAQLTQALGMFDAYAIAKRNTPECVDATVKADYCRQRIAALVTEPEAQRGMLSQARRSYMETIQQFPDHPLVPLMTMESARIVATMRSPQGAAATLAQFQSPPLKSSRLAPLALIYMSDLQRAAGRASAAVTVLSQVQKEYEAALLKDPARADWVPMLHYAMAMALKESGQYQPARDLFNSIAANYPKRPEAAECAWRLRQCEKEQATSELMALRVKLSNASGADARAAVLAEIETALAKLRQAAQGLSAAAAALAKQTPDSPTALLMHYDSAWAWRKVAEFEVESARRQLQQKAMQEFRQKQKANGAAAAGTAPRAKAIPVEQIPLQPAEQQVRAEYKAILDANSDSPIVSDARLELAEVHLQRDEYAPAVELLQQMLQSDPAPELADRIRLRLGAACIAKNDFKGAVAAFDAILQNATSAYQVYAREGSAEVKFLQGDYAGAVQTLSPFIEGQPLRVAAGARDRAVLRVAQSYAKLGQWENCRNILEVFVARFPWSTLLGEARFELGTAYQTLKQYDAAVAAYESVGRTTGSEIAARGLYQAGLCRLEQKRPDDANKLFYEVIYTYDYPELTALAKEKIGRP